MKVSIIRDYTAGFISHLKDDSVEILMDKYDLVATWSDNWNIVADDLVGVFEASLDSKISGRLWGGSKHSMKSEMIKLIQFDKDFMRSTFRDLFRDENDLGLRVDRFIHHVDELYKNLKKIDKKAIDHRHQSRADIALYLAAEYPEAYCLFDYPTFNAMMEKLASRNIPTEVELERYYKSMRAIYQLITKEVEVIQLMAFRCAVAGVTFIPSLMIMNDFAEFVVST